VLLSASSTLTRCWWPGLVFLLVVLLAPLGRWSSAERWDLDGGDWGAFDDDVAPSALA